jgi:hypothetical protein
MLESLDPIDIFLLMTPVSVDAADDEYDSSIQNGSTTNKYSQRQQILYCASYFFSTWALNANVVNDWQTGQFILSILFNINFVFY